MAILYQMKTVYLLLCHNKNTDQYDEKGCFGSRTTADLEGTLSKGPFKILEQNAFVAEGNPAGVVDAWLAGRPIFLGASMKDIRKREAMAKLTAEEKEALGLVEGS